MYGRWFHTTVICFWCAAMSWLAAEKILPALMNGDPPDYTSPLRSPNAPPESWTIEWNERTLGFAASQVKSLSDSRTELRSVVLFDDVPLESMAAELFGPLAALIKPLFVDRRDLPCTVQLATRMQFDQHRELESFRTTVGLGKQQTFLRVDGRVQASGKLLLEATLDDGMPHSAGRDLQVVRREVDLPPHTLVTDSLTPRTELKNLFVGQTWTMPVCRALPSHSPVQIVQAQVQRHEVVFWDSVDVETMVVVYRADAGSNISLARDPIGREWINRDGLIIRRELIFSGLQLIFERLPTGSHDPRVRLLETEFSELPAGPGD